MGSLVGRPLCEVRMSVVGKNIIKCTFFLRQGQISERHMHLLDCVVRRWRFSNRTFETGASLQPHLRSHRLCPAMAQYSGISTAGMCKG